MSERPIADHEYQPQPRRKPGTVGVDLYGCMICGRAQLPYHRAAPEPEPRPSGRTLTPGENAARGFPQGFPMPAEPRPEPEEPRKVTARCPHCYNGVLIDSEATRPAVSQVGALMQSLELIAEAAAKPGTLVSRSWLDAVARACAEAHAALASLPAAERDELRERCAWCGRGRDTGHPFVRSDVAQQNVCGPCIEAAYALLPTPKAAVGAIAPTGEVR